LIQAKASSGTVTGTALALRDQLADEGLPSWPKLTGGKGLHLMVPLLMTCRYEELHLWTTAILLTAKYATGTHGFVILVVKSKP
jgi:DNA primase